MSQIKAAKSRKKTTAKKSGQKSPAKGKSRQINAEDSRASSKRVTTPEPPTEDSINARLTKMRVLSKSGEYKSKPIKINKYSCTWIRAMASEGVSRVTLMNCLHVTRGTYSKFLEKPEKYLTLHDLFFFAALTGISVGRQIELLWTGVEGRLISPSGVDYREDNSSPSNLSRLVAED